MNFNTGFNREIFGYIRTNAEEKGLEQIPAEIIDNMENDPDMLLITESGLNPFSEDTMEVTEEKTIFTDETNSNDEIFSATAEEEAV